MIEKAYRPAKPDRAGKDYRPKEDEGHTFFFKGYYIFISSDFKNVSIAEIKRNLPPVHCNTLDDALVKGMEEIHNLRDKDYEETMQKMAEEEKEKQIRKQLAPFINAIIKEINY